jgi:uncharacterized protein YbaP (TraB family)
MDFQANFWISMLEKKDGIVVENHCPVESNSDCIVEAQTVLDDDSDISTHGVLYDDLIKEKMKDMENEITSKLGSPFSALTNVYPWHIYYIQCLL